MSPAGALVEAAALPPAGSQVRLVRGSLSAEGRVAWAGHGRCGIHFESLMTVHEWMAPPKNREQARVDETMTLLRAQAVPLRTAQRPVADDVAGKGSGDAQLIVDLREIGRLLDLLSAELAGDPEIVRRHGRALQSADIASQSLEAAIDALTNPSDRPAVLSERLRALRVARAPLIG